MVMTVEVDLWLWHDIPNDAQMSDIKKAGVGGLFFKVADGTHINVWGGQSDYERANDAGLAVIPWIFVSSMSAEAINVARRQLEVMERVSAIPFVVLDVEMHGDSSRISDFAAAFGGWWPTYVSSFAFPRSRHGGNIYWRTWARANISGWMPQIFPFYPGWDGAFKTLVSSSNEYRLLDRDLSYSPVLEPFTTSKAEIEPENLRLSLEAVRVLQFDYASVFRWGQKFLSQACLDVISEYTLPQAVLPVPPAAAAVPVPAAAPKSCCCECCK